MGKILVVAEKPSAGKDMARVLECGDSKNGYIEGADYIVTWAVGHLIGLKMPEEHDAKLKEWRMESLPIIFDIKDSLKVLPDTKGQFDIVKSLIHRPDVDYIINAGDAGREGYLIQSWIYRYAGCKKPVKILWANSLTDEALRKAFANLKDEDVFFKNLLQEAEARAEADYLLGMNYSRAMTLTKSRDITLSYGRCQTPLLNLIVQRDLEIENFVPKPYYQLQADYQGFKGICIGEDEKPQIFEKREEAEEILKYCKGKKAIVISCEAENKKKKAPLLFSLAELQKEMGKKFKYTPDETLETAQRLYETYKMISYPRTDSCYLSMDLYNEIDRHIRSCDFGKFHTAVEKINMSGIQADKSYFNDAKVTDHHAMIPTINNSMEREYEKLGEKERNVFEAVVYRFLAVFYPPYEYCSTTLITASENIKFKSQGISVINPGYRVLLQGDKEETKEEEQHVPFLEKGSEVEIQELELLSRKTMAPSRYSIESIITLMQKYHIGTSATMAEIIKKLQNPKRQSIVLEKGIYRSTSFGRKYISVVPEKLKSPELTKEIEEKLFQIGEGHLTKEIFLKEITDQIRSYIASVKGESNPVLEQEPVGICPACGNKVRDSRFYYACEKGCFRLGKTICGKNISRKIAEDILKTGKTGIIKGFIGKTGRSFDARLIYRKGSGNIEFEFPKSKEKMRE